MFQLTQDHVDLIRSLRISETDKEDVASSDSHFYREGEVFTKIGQVASSKIFEELFEDSSNVDKFNWLKSELGIALEVVLASGSTKPGTYLKDGDTWYRVRGKEMAGVPA